MGREIHRPAYIRGYARGEKSKQIMLTFPFADKDMEKEARESAKKLVSAMNRDGRELVEMRDDAFEATKAITNDTDKWHPVLTFILDCMEEISRKSD